MTLGEYSLQLNEEASLFCHFLPCHKIQQRFLVEYRQEYLKRDLNPVHPEPVFHPTAQTAENCNAELYNFNFQVLTELAP